MRGWCPVVWLVGLSPYYWGSIPPASTKAKKFKFLIPKFCKLKTEKYPLPSREKSSHKGQNGKVLIIGGNRYYHGAPILAALGAERSGVDLVYLMIPELHKGVARGYSLNFIVHPLKNDHLNTKDMRNVAKLMSEVDVICIGNGIGQKDKTREAILQIIEKSKIPVVLDADGLFPHVLGVRRNCELVLTPHEKEFTQMFNCKPSKEKVGEMAHKYRVHILLTGETDLIAVSSCKENREQGVENSEVIENKTGCPQMTVGGTGDALSGIVTGFMAQGLAPREAMISAAYYWGKCGEVLSQKKSCFTAQEMLEEFVMKEES